MWTLTSQVLKFENGKISRILRTSGKHDRKIGLRQAPELSFCARRSVKPSRIDVCSPEAPRSVIVGQNGPPKSPKLDPEIQGLSSYYYHSSYSSSRL